MHHKRINRHKFNDISQDERKSYISNEILQVILKFYNNDDIAEKSSSKKIALNLSV